MAYADHIKRDVSARIKLALLAAAVLTSATALSPYWGERSAAQTAKRAENERRAVDGQGRAVVEYRWPLGTPDHVVKLRIPVGYSWFGGGGVGAALGTSYPDPNVVGPYTQTIIIQALMPDLGPKTSDNTELFKGDINERVTRISIVAAARSKFPGALVIDNLFHDFYPLVLGPGEQQIYKMRFGPKLDRYGLKHDGAIDGDFSQFRKLFVVHDIFYPATDPKSMYLICAADEIKDVIEDPSWDRKPICQHYFYSVVLGATVKLLYRRIYAADWRGIQERVERLFSSFEIVEP